MTQPMVAPVSLIHHLLNKPNICYRLLIDLFVLLVLASNQIFLTMNPSKRVFFLNAEHRVSSYRRNNVQALFRPICATRNDCPFDNTFCNIVQHKCQCEADFVQVGNFVNKSYITHLAMTCLAVARLDERCISDHQCIVDYSECKLTTQVVAGVNRTSHFCKCSHGHELDEHDSADIILNGRTYQIRPICSWEKSGSSSWMSAFILISLLVIFILIGTFVALVRYQRWRNQSFSSTITSIAASPCMNSNVAANNQMGSSSPPPMGSVEAEFQNDFIQVFPMHHLEPMPDKNAHAFIIR